MNKQPLLAITNFFTADRVAYDSGIMKFRKIFTCLLIVTLMSSCGGGSSDSGAGIEPVVPTDPTVVQPPAPEPSVRSFVAIGDSIGNGAGFVSRPWPELVQGGFGVPLVNDSVNGRQTGEGLAVMRSLLDRHNPSHVLILLGTNDATKGGSVGGAIANLQEMANIAENRGIIAVIGTTLPNRRSAEFNQKSADIAAGIRGINNAVIAETRIAFGDVNVSLQDDVHPNIEGHRRIADAFIDVIR